jgi:predicted nucleotidyltransferase
MATSLLEQRRQFSQEQLRELGLRLNSLPEIHRLPKLCVYATGSYARNEASEHSDIDLFFIHEGSSKTSSVAHLDELSLFARVIEIGGTMKFPTFSNDGEFLKILYLDDMLEMLGGREDDYKNSFTARMLLLLESSALVNPKLLNAIFDSFVEAYFRDYPSHSADFRPVFLINDVLRFWKTLCLNYENRRNRPDDNVAQKRKQQVKNFKLKFSRLMTCFGTIVAVCAKATPISKADIVELGRVAPLDRFLSVASPIRDLDEVRQAVLQDYEWFLQNTALSTSELTSRFDSSDTKMEMFRRAEVYGDRVYQVLKYFAERNGYSRYLIV